MALYHTGKVVVDCAEGDSSNGLLGVLGEAEGGCYEGASHRHGVQASPQTVVLQ